jgi:hypothetical protein
MGTRVVPGAVAAVFLAVLAFHSGGYFASEWGLVALVFLLPAVTALLVADSLTVDRAGLVLVASLLGLALWQVLSVLWSTGAGMPIQEAERTLVYVSAGAALLLCLTPARVQSLLTGVVAGTTVVAMYALGTRLAPGTLGGAYDPSSGYQLAKPIGYGNALGLLFVFGITLAAGIALHARPVLAMTAGAALVPLSVATYFTFSRGAFVALALALGIMVVLEADRLLAAGTLAALLAGPAVGVLIASRSPALTAPGATLQTAQLQGHRLGWQLLVLGVVAAGTTWGVRTIGRHVAIPDRARRAAALAVCAAAVAVLAVGIVRAGDPRSIVSHVKRGFVAPPPPTERGPAGRLLSSRGNGRADYWTVAARMVRRDPMLGDGAGSFAQRWTQERPVANGARDAHNLYLETLAELGPGGLALLLVSLAAPLTVLRRSRSGELAPAAAGMYVAFLVHATLDWDWEIPLLTVLGLSCGVSLIVLAPSRSVAMLTTSRRSLLLVAAAAMLFCALVAHVGNRAAAEATQALSRGETRAATSNALRARTWMPWSHEPWQLLGESQLREGAAEAAIASLRHAVSLDPVQWSVWLDLALAEHGTRAAHARARATDLNPLGVGSSLPADGHRRPCSRGVAFACHSSYHR